jgi:hypothetical protein
MTPPTDQDACTLAPPAANDVPTSASASPPGLPRMRPDGPGIYMPLEGIIFVLGSDGLVTKVHDLRDVLG